MRATTRVLAAAVLLAACGDDALRPTNTPPRPSFTADCRWLTCGFVDSSSDADGRITAWAWDFGDSASSSETGPTHVYRTGGQFTVTLQVTDDAGAQASTTRQVSVRQANTPPTADFELVCGGPTCLFTDTSVDPDSGGRIVSRAWDFGDGRSSSKTDPIHPYHVPGQFTVWLSVADDQGDTASVAKPATVTFRDPSGTYERETPHPTPGRMSRYVIRSDGRFDLQDWIGSDTTVYSGTWDFAVTYMGRYAYQDGVILLDFDGFESTDPFLPVEGIGEFLLDGYLAISYGASLVQAGQDEGVYTTTPGAYLQPPPVAGEVAFERDGRIYLANTDGSGVVALSQGPEDYEPAWSPDGQRLAFERCGNGSCAVYTMNADGSNVVQRATSGRSPTWSPDGKWIAFACWPSFCKVNAEDGTDPVWVYADGTGSLESPAWSPAGDRLAYTSDAAFPDFWFDIWTVALDGSQATPLRQHSEAAPTDDGQYYPAWSPDGDRIAYRECPWAFTRCSSSVIAVMNADGSTPTRLVATSGGGRPTWSPDGRVIAFGSTIGIEWVSADGRARGRIISNGRQPAWRP